MTAKPNYLEIAADYDAAGAILDSQMDIALAAQSAPGLPIDFAAFWPPANRPSAETLAIIANVLGSQLHQAAAGVPGREAPPGVGEMFAMLGASEVEGWIRSSAAWCRETAGRIRNEEPDMVLAIDAALA